MWFRLHPFSASRKNIYQPKQKAHAHKKSGEDDAGKLCDRHIALDEKDEWLGAAFEALPHGHIFNEGAGSYDDHAPRQKPAGPHEYLVAGKHTEKNTGRTQSRAV